MNERTDAMINGVLIALGAAGVLDNLVIHWILGLHRLGPWGDPITLYLEAGLIVLGAAILTIGAWREWTARTHRYRGPLHR